MNKEITVEYRPEIRQKIDNFLNNKIAYPEVRAELENLINEAASSTIRVHYVIPVGNVEKSFAEKIIDTLKKPFSKYHQRALDKMDPKPTPESREKLLNEIREDYEAHHRKDVNIVDQNGQYFIPFKEELERWQN